jgi:hypothetical protein
MKRINLLLIGTIILIIMFSGCADVENIDKCVTGHTYGFFGGLWHGIITPFSFIGSLFSDEISVYAINNSGGWYDFGFLLGVGGLGFGSSKAGK